LGEGATAGLASLGSDFEGLELWIEGKNARVRLREFEREVENSISSGEIWHD
jgi:hypothetical protein